jgi:hypothetical protein
MAESSIAAIRTLAPLALLAFMMWSVATSWGEAAIYFSPAEVDLLIGALIESVGALRRVAPAYA